MEVIHLTLTVLLLSSLSSLRLLFLAVLVYHHNAYTRMSGSHTVEVDSFSPDGKLALVLAHPCSAKQAVDAIGRRLELKPASLQVFGIFLGPLGSPRRALEDSETIPLGASLSFQRWSFDMEKESGLVRHDDVAISLLYSEARFYLDQGKIEPNEAQRQELESLSDPTFPTERQFLEVVRTIPGYSSYCAAGCALQRDVVSNDVQVPSGTVVSCITDFHGLCLQAGKTKADWQWELVRRWKAPTSTTVKFEVCNQKGTASVMEWVILETPQAYFLLSTASSICDTLKQKHNAKSQPLAPSNPKLAGRPYDPLYEFVNTELFGVTQFSTLDHKR